jgi:N-acetylneuraminate synthase
MIQPGDPCYIIAEIGINHNGDVDTALDMIAAAKAAGANAVKFQKRTVEDVYTAEELAKPRESEFGSTNGALKYGLEFGYRKYQIIDEYCKSINMPWFASCWDPHAVDVIALFDVPYFKIASASLTDDDLLEYTRMKRKPIILSTGMSTLVQVGHAIKVLGKEELILLHCCSAYPAHNDELNLNAIRTLKQYYGLPVGYSGHELAIVTTVAAVALGACVVERHLTLSRDMWGSDQAASLEPAEFAEMVRDIRWVEEAMGDGVKRVYEREIPIMAKLRRNG